MRMNLGIEDFFTSLPVPTPYPPYTIFLLRPPVEVELTFLRAHSIQTGRTSDRGIKALVDLTEISSKSPDWESPRCVISPVAGDTKCTFRAQFCSESCRF